MGDVAPHGGWKRRTSDRQTRLERWVLNINPILSALFYMGFVTTSIFIVIIYSHSITDRAAKATAAVHKNIVTTEVQACRRDNEERRAFNRHIRESIHFAQILRDQTNQSPAQKRAGAVLLKQRKLPLVDCNEVGRMLGQTLDKQTTSTP